MRLEGRTALVTGASQGLGRVIAVRFAREGAKVVLAARSRERLEETAAEIEAAGGWARVVPTDLREPAEVDALAQRIEAEAGTFDVFVANSGITADRRALEGDAGGMGRHAARQRHWDVPAAPRAAPADDRAPLGQHRGDRLDDRQASMFGRSPYAASKLALVGLVRTLAAELGPLGVRVNLISPGGVAGARIEGVIREQAKAAGMSYEAFYEEATKATPLRRLIPPEDVAAAAVFLASEDSASTTGEDLNVSGGLAMY